MGKRKRKHAGPVTEPRALAPSEGRPRPKILEYAIVRMGVPLAIAALASAFLAMEQFWPGVVCLYAGCGLLALDLTYEDLLRKMPFGVRVALALLYVAIVVAVSAIWVFRAAPIEAWASSTVPVYGPGSKIDGIDWQPYYSDMHFYIKNPTRVDYKDFDAEVSTDLVINTIKQTRGLAECEIAGIHSTDQVHWQTMVGNQPVGPADNPIVSYLAIPIDKNGNPTAPVTGGADWTYRIRCDRIPANSELDFFAPLEVVNKITASSPKTANLFGEPRSARWITIAARYKASGRARAKLVSQCAIGQVCSAN